MDFCISTEFVRKDSAFLEKREVNAMEKIKKKTILYTIGVAILLVIAYYSRAFHTEVDNPILKMLLVMTRSVIQISLVIAWCSSVRTRIINKQVRHYLMAVGILEMSRYVQSKNPLNLKYTQYRICFSEWSVAKRRKTDSRAAVRLRFFGSRLTSLCN